ncbi:hypothetical protein ABT275_27300 [Streptomyces sp. NPDC001185]|uniref:hypothetical protein n=1 Tax=Streptomyces sp. NPDC001185 TaxID=3154380 RepID=UPI00331BB579
MSDAMVMRYSGWTFAFDGRSLTIVRRGMPWRRKRVEHLPLGRLRACYLHKSESHDVESLGFCLVYDTDAVLIGIDRQYYEGDAYWFSEYLSEAICERLRRVFHSTIGLGPHPEAELLGVVRPALHLHPHSFSMGDVPYRLAALRKEDPMVSGRRMPGPPRPFGLQTNHASALDPSRPNFENWWTFVEHIRAGYEPMDDPGWEEVVQELRRGGLMMTQSNWKQYNRSGDRKPGA